MATKKRFSFDEEKEAEEIFKNGFPGGKLDYGKMYLIAKYFREIFGYGEVRLERELLKFCKEHDKNFNPVTEMNTMKKWIRTAMQYKLRKVTSVVVTNSEINLLKTIEDKKDRKILFATLVLSKALNQQNTRAKSDIVYTSYYIWYTNLIEIAHLSRISGLKETEVALAFHRHKNLFTFYSPEKGGIKLNYAETGEEGVIIDDPDNTSVFYETIFGMFCEKCGNSFVKKNSKANNQRFCNKCSAEIRKEKERERKRLVRSKLSA